MSKQALTYYKYLRDQGVPEELAAKVAMEHESSVEDRIERSVGPLRSEMSSIRLEIRHQLYWLLGIIITSNAAFTYIAKHL